MHLKRKPEPVLLVLAEALNDPEAEVKIAALGVLGDIGPAVTLGQTGKDAVARLTELSKDSNSNQDVRKAALEALKKIGPVPPP